jgi:hypothetical protein
MPVNVSAQEADNIENKLRTLIDDAEDVYRVRMKIAKEHYKNYNSIRSKRNYIGRADVFVPFSYIVVETLVAKIMKIIYSEPVLVSLQGIGPSDKDREERLRALYHIQQKKTVKLWSKLADYWRTRCMYGRSYARIDWRSDYRTITKTVITDKDGKEIENLQEFNNPPEEEMDVTAERFLEEFDADTEQGDLAKPFTVTQGGINDDKRITVTNKQERVVDYDCWDFTNLDFFDVLVDPMAPDASIQRARWVAIRSYITDDELEEWGNRTNSDDKPIFQHWKDSINAGTADGDINEDILDRKQLLGLDVRALRDVRGDTSRHELHEVYMDYRFEGDKEVSKNALFYLINRTTLIRAEKNAWWHGRKPIISGAYTRRPNEFLGQGALDPVRKIQYEINDKRNQELDAASFTMSPIWLVGDDAELEDENIRISNQTAIKVADINAIRPLVFPDMTSVGQRAGAILEENMRETTGVTRSIQGISDPGRQTASEFNQLINQASERIFMVVEAFGQEDWAEMWEMVHSLNQQFMKEDTFIRLTERESTSLKTFGASGKVTQADLAMEVDFVTPSFQDVQIDNTRNQQIIPFMNIVSQMPPSEGNAQFFNMFIEKLWVDVFKYPREDLRDDKGEFILLTPPGFKSIYDTDIQEEINQGVDQGLQGIETDLAAQQQEQQAAADAEAQAAQAQAPGPEGAPAPQEGGGQPIITDEELADLAEGLI